MINDVDIIIPVHGQFDLLLRCLNALPEAFKDVNYKVIMVDDASPDDLDVFLAGATDEAGYMKPNYRVLRNTEKRGFPYTCNRGMNAGVAPILLFLNSDCILEPEAGNIMLRSIEDKSVGIVGPLLLFPSDSPYQGRPANKVQHAGIAFDIFGNPIHLFVGWNPDNPKVKIRREMQAVTGACLMIKRDTAKDVSALIHKYDKSHKQGLFQEDYGLGTYEDIEACFAVRILGKKVIFEPKAVGKHYVGASAIAANVGFPMQRNEMIFRARFGPSIMWDEHNFA